MDWCLHFNKFPAILEKDFVMQIESLIMIKLVLLVIIYLR